MMRKRWIGRAWRVALFGIAGAAVVGEVAVQLWNRILPQLFGFHAISFWQALGLLLLGRLLFGGFHGRPGSRMHWRRRMFERWDQMTPEERNRFKDGMKRRCGGWEERTERKGSGPGGVLADDLRA